MSTSFRIYAIKTKAGQKLVHTQSCLYSNQIDPLPQQLLGDARCGLVRVSAGQRFLPAIYCRDQLMAVRFFPKNWSAAFEAETLSAPQLQDLLLGTLLELKARKNALIGQPEDAFRWVHGDADGVPGIVIDDYGSIVVVQSGSQFGDFLLPTVVSALERATAKPVFERSSGQIRALEKLPERTRWIRPPESANLEVVQTSLAGLKLQFRPQRCQKTGLFIDQRENLEIFSALVARTKTQSMLDLCSYVGAWSCAGARGGAQQFTLVDQDKDALEMSQTNISANAVGSGKTSSSTLHGDLFEILSKLGKDKSKFGAVVADPPAFTKSAKHVPEARRAYQRLSKLASRLVEPGGIYVACSCSRHIDEEDFYEIVSGALDTDDWIYLGRGRQSADHTVLATDKQSLYLKALFFMRRNALAQISPQGARPQGDAP